MALDLPSVAAGAVATAAAALLLEVFKHRLAERNRRTSDQRAALEALQDAVESLYHESTEAIFSGSPPPDNRKLIAVVRQVSRIDHPPLRIAVSRLAADLAEAPSVAVPPEIPNGLVERHLNVQDYIGRLVSGQEPRVKWDSKRSVRRAQKRLRKRQVRAGDRAGDRAGTVSESPKTISEQADHDGRSCALQA